MKYLLASLLVLAALLPARTCLAQPGERVWGRLERFGPPRAGVITPPPSPPAQTIYGDSLLAYYALDETSGTRADSIHGYDLTAYNAPGDTAGVRGRALLLRSDQMQYLSRTDYPSVFGGSFSVAYWWRAYYVSSQAEPVQYGRTISGPSLGWCVFNQTTTSGQMRIGSSATTSTSWSGASPTTWNFTTVVFNNSVDTQYVYLNGTLSGKSYRGDNSQIPTPSMYENFWIGQDGANAAFFQGAIDEVYYWRGLAVPQDFIGWLYNGGTGRSLQEVITYSP